MAGATTNHEIAYSTTDDQVTIATSTANLAGSVENALNELITDNRQAQDYIWANAAARTAQEDMRTGDLGLQEDTGIVWRFIGGAWKMWDVPSTNITPAVTGTNIGTTGTSTAVWSMASGRVFVEGIITLGGTGIVVGTTSIATPVTSTTAAANTPRGIIVFADVSPSGSYPGTVLYATTTTVIPVVHTASGTYAQNAFTTTVIPITWAAGDYMSYSYSFIAA